MNEGAGRWSTAAEVLAVAAAVVFAAGAVYLLGAPDLVMLRLAVLAWPAWPVYVLGAVQLAGALGLLRTGTRALALLLLAVISAGELAASIVYREIQPAVQAIVQLLLLTGIVLLGRRRAN